MCFPDRWKGRHNNVENYCGVAILSAIPKRYSTWFYEEPVTNLLECASFVLNSIEKGWQVDSVYTDFSKAFDRVRHQLLLEKMSVGSIEPAAHGYCLI
jgi:hypothetical protein